MTSATGVGGTATYTYNGDGLKIRRIGPDGTTRYYYDDIRPIWEADGGGSMTAQLDRDIFGNLLSRKEPAGARRYYHFDGLGSSTALSDESGAAVATLLYDAWGNQRAIAGSGHSNYRFAGTEFDSTTGFYHMGARFYDPALGRWLSEDTVQDKNFEPASLNFYAYAFNNPLIYVDPDGKEAGVFDQGEGCGVCSGGAILVGFGLLQWLQQVLANFFSSPSSGKPKSSEDVKEEQGKKAGQQKAKEPTPETARGEFEHITVNGQPAFRNKRTGEIWIEDKKAHGGKHYEVYRNMKDAEKGKRQREVWADGTKKKIHFIP